MITEKDKTAIRRIARKYKASRIFLFGSNLDPVRKAHDIDLAVEGVSPESFFRFYGELLWDLSKPVDLIDLSIESDFNRLIRKEGVMLYGKSKPQNSRRTGKHRKPSR